ncbi:MAG: DUF4838 domain-containing protein [Candidatus Hydrogenedentes bacterium]|nr:DUF4838 domain-containing protein [Candidatus Hydrogenedentota bacterium]
MCTRNTKRERAGAGYSARRTFLKNAARALAGAGAALALGSGCETMTHDRSHADGSGPFFRTRGVVVVPEDIASWNWPEKAKEAGLTTIATHPFPAEVEAFTATDEWHAFQEACRRLGLHIEHELHAMGELLPRDLFDRNPDMFRMDEHGDRVPDWNLCVHSPQAIEVVCENLMRYAGKLRPTTGRHFYWIDDGRPMCRCPECRGLTDSEQALLLENHMADAIRRAYPGETVAHLAYLRTLDAPAQVRPHPGVFLEWAPITRRFDRSIADRDAHGDTLDSLAANIEVFGADGAQVLEYWLDESLFYRAQRPPELVKIPWHADVFHEDVDTYAGLGVRHITSFGVKVNGEYVSRFGEPPLNEYGSYLAGWRPRSR